MLLSNKPKPNRELGLFGETRDLLKMDTPSGDGFTVFMAADSGNVPCKEEEREAFLAHRRLYELDQYYGSIKDYTFRTEFLELSIEEVKAWRVFNRNGKMTEEENQLFEQLKSKVSAFKNLTINFGSSIKKLKLSQTDKEPL